MTENFEGRCACGAVHYRLASRPMFVHCCHCRDCQQQTGSAFVLNALIEADRVALLSGNPEPVAVPTSSGKPHQIYRCPTCEVAVWSVYGGVDKLRLTFFKEGDIGSDGVWDRWMLEGPAFAWYFRGSPHVHTWLNVARKA